MPTLLALRQNLYSALHNQRNRTIDWVTVGTRNNEWGLGRACQDKSTLKSTEGAQDAAGAGQPQTTYTQCLGDPVKTGLQTEQKTSCQKTQSLRTVWFLFSSFDRMFLIWVRLLLPTWGQTEDSLE